MPDTIFRYLFAAILIICGLGYCALRIMADAMGDPDRGFWNGNGPVLLGLLCAAAGGLLVIF